MGKDTPNSANVIDARSATVRRFRAEMMPIGMPMTSHRITAPNVSTRVTGNARAISARTSTRLDHE